MDRSQFDSTLRCFQKKWGYETCNTMSSCEYTTNYKMERTSVEPTEPIQKVNWRVMDKESRKRTLHL
jgi:hypothetical protein